MVNQFPVAKIKLKRNGELSVWQYSVYVAKSIYWKQHGNVLQLNPVALLGICPEQNNDHHCPSKTMGELLITEPQMYF